MIGRHRSEAGIGVRSIREESSRSSWEMTSSAASMGTLVKRLVTSKLTMLSSVPSLLYLIRLTISAEFLTLDCFCPPNGARVQVSSLANL